MHLYRGAAGRQETPVLPHLLANKHDKDGLSQSSGRWGSKLLLFVLATGNPMKETDAGMVPEVATVNIIRVQWREYWQKGMSLLLRVQLVSKK